MKKYMRFVVASKGDNSSKDWSDLIRLLDNGYEIVSGVADGNVIYYILRLPIIATKGEGK